MLSKYPLVPCFRVSPWCSWSDSILDIFKSDVYNFDIAIRQFIEYLVFGDTSKSLLIDYLNISDD